MAVALAARVRGGDAEVVDGPFAVTKEVLAGYYLVDCADLDEALALAKRLPPARWGTIEVRPAAPVAEWREMGLRAGIELAEEDMRNLW